MKTIKNFELKVKRVAVGEGTEPYGSSVRSPPDVAKIARALIGDSAQEHFCVFLLDVKNRVIGYTEAARGGVDTCPVDPRMVFRAAVATGASAVVVTHNHPSGDLRPSAEDLHLTERLKAGGDLLGIPLLDHVIVTDAGTTSLRERGQL